MAATGLVLALTRAEFNAFLVWQVASLGFLAAGFALSLRTATPNLAVGAFAVLAGMIYARLVNEEMDRRRRRHRRGPGRAGRGPAARAR